jgi:hypothetical protein
MSLILEDIDGLIEELKQTTKDNIAAGLGGGIGYAGYKAMQRGGITGKDKKKTLDAGEITKRTAATIGGAVIGQKIGGHIGSAVGGTGGRVAGTMLGGAAGSIGGNMLMRNRKHAKKKYGDHDKSKD